MTRMSKKKNNISNSNPTYEVVKKIRGDWGGVKPYTRVEESRKYKKPKHIKRERERYLEE